MSGLAVRRDSRERLLERVGLNDTFAPMVVPASSRSHETHGAARHAIPLKRRAIAAIVRAGHGAEGYLIDGGSDRALPSALSHSASAGTSWARPIPAPWG
jgi:hypothetical protein